MGGGVADSLVFYQGLLQQCVDAVAFPVHWFSRGKKLSAFSYRLSACPCTVQSS
jgi:hypothetical protein